MDLTFDLVGRIAVWMFISEIIVLILFKKAGKQFTFRLGSHLFIKKSKYILLTFVIFLGIGIIQSLTKFVDNTLITFIGSSFLLYLIAFSFDFFYIARELANLRMKNNWVRIPLIISLVLFLLSMILKYA